MNQYIALLRGINVSGKNQISMPILKDAFITAGFSNVSTYINSGNVLFSSTISDATDLSQLCNNLIKDKFQLDIPVAVISLIELTQALDNAPEWWDIESSTEVIHQAIFLISPATIEEVYKAIGDANLEYEQVYSYGNVIFWSAPRATLSKTRWYKIPSSSANRKVTIRNANTTKKLKSLSKNDN